jgi:tetratricopeptide (TPR) repeat protein
VSLIAVSADAVRDRLAKAQRAMDRHDYATALQWMDQARVADTQSTLIAYERGCVLAALERFAEAEREFERAAEDDFRRAAASYNRGLCQARGAQSSAEWRAAIDSFQTAASSSTDPQLRDDARFNLELAKLKWALLNRDERRPKTPGEDKQQDKPSKQNTASSPNSASNTANKNVTTTNDAASGPPQATDAAPKPGAGTLPVLRDDAVLVPLSVDETNHYLQQVMQRLTKQRQAMDRLKATSPRPRVLDW